MDKQKWGKKHTWMSIGFAAFLLLAFIVSDDDDAPQISNDAPQVNLPHAKPYKIYQTQAVGVFGPRNVEILITSEQPQTADGFAQTAMQAVVDAMARGNLDYVRVKLYGFDNTYSNTQHSEFLLAMAIYRTKNSPSFATNKWDVMAKARRLTRDEVWIARYWNKFRLQFKEDGYVNELKLKTFLFEGMQKTKVLTQEMKDKYPSAKQIHLPYVEFTNNYKIPDD